MESSVADPSNTVSSWDDVECICFLPRDECVCGMSVPEQVPLELMPEVARRCLTGQMMRFRFSSD